MVDVIDLQIENTKNFVANGVVVHNSTFESLACETPVIVTMTGGLQEQVTDLSNIEVTEEMMLKRNIEKVGTTQYEHGFGIEPSSKSIIGSQQVPYIAEDRINKKDFIQALMSIHTLSAKQRRELGKTGREHIMKNYNFQEFLKKWDDLFMSVYEKNGSWSERKNYKTWELRSL